MRSRNPILHVVVALMSALILVAFTLNYDAIDSWCWWNLPF